MASKLRHEQRVWNQTGKEKARPRTQEDPKLSGLFFQLRLIYFRWAFCTDASYRWWRAAQKTQMELGPWRGLDVEMISAFVFEDAPDFCISGKTI